MSEPFTGQIIMFGGNFAIRNFAFCDGQLMAIAQNNALFSLLGTTYGGDGRTTFGLPDLRGRVPMHEGQSPGMSFHPLGSRGGAETNVMTQAQMPVHNHGANLSLNVNTSVSATLKANSGNLGGSPSPASHVLGAASGNAIYSSSAPNADMSSGAIEATATTTDGGSSVTVANAGGSQPINNMQPYQVINFQIALYGTYPSRN